MSTRWSNPTRYIVGVGLARFGLYVLYISGPVITMLIIAALMAFVLSPVVTFLQRRLKFPRIAAVLTAYLLLILLLLLAPLLFLPPIIDGYNAIASVDFQSLANRISTGLRDYAYTWPRETRPQPWQCWSHYANRWRREVGRMNGSR